MMHDIPAQFLPPDRPEDAIIRLAEKFDISKELEAAEGQRLSLIRVGRRIADFCDDMVREGLIERRPVIFLCLNRKGVVSVGIGDRDMDKLKEAIELDPTAYCNMVEMHS
jgi:hypothetical protein